MSRENKDRDYRPGQKILQERRTHRRSRQVESVDYSECELESDTEVVSIISEGNRTLVDVQLEVKSETLESAWTPGTFSSHIDQVGEQRRRLSHHVRQQQSMAQQQESGMEKMFQVFLQMRQEDKDREDRRERERIDRDERREREREERQIQLIQQLKEAQPVVPQQIYVSQHKLPTMTEKDDIELFIRQLEIALRTALIPQDKWKQHLLSQLTVQAKDQVIGLLEDDASDYEDIKQALLGRNTMTFAMAAEAFFTGSQP